MSAAAVCWCGTTLRVAHGAKSAAFYEKHFQLTLVCRASRPGSTSYYLFSFKDKPESLPEVGSPEAEEFLCKHSSAYFLELLQEDDAPPAFVPSSGNEEPFRGFGHLAFNVEELRPFCVALEAEGVKFKKRPDEGTMKFLAFAYDLDGYWLELVERGASEHGDRINLSQTMIRVADPSAAMKFYGALSLKRLYEMKYETFELTFMTSARETSLPTVADYESAEAKERFLKSWEPVLELTQNYDSTDPAKFHTGNASPKGFVGLKFLTDDVTTTVEALRAAGVEVLVRKEGVSAYCFDSTGYLVNVVQRGTKWTAECVTPP